MRFIDPMKEFFKFLRLMASDERGQPSSSRVIGFLVFTSLIVSIIAITAVLLWKIVVTVDQVNLSTVVTALSKSMWIFLILAATALSLYGINIWRYVACIRAGGIGDQMIQNGMYGGMGGMNNSMMNPSMMNPSMMNSNMGMMNNGMMNPSMVNNGMGGVAPLPGNVINQATAVVGQMPLLGQGGSAGTQIIKTEPGRLMEHHTDPIPPKIRTTEPGVGSDD